MSVPSGSSSAGRLKKGFRVFCCIIKFSFIVKCTVRGFSWDFSKLLSRNGYCEITVELLACAWRSFSVRKPRFAAHADSHSTAVLSSCSGSDCNLGLLVECIMDNGARGVSQLSAYEADESTEKQRNCEWKTAQYFNIFRTLILLAEMSRKTITEIRFALNVLTNERSRKEILFI